MRAVSEDLRVRVLEDCDAGGRTRAVAAKYRVSESRVRRLKQRRRETGETAPRSSRNGRSPKWLAHADRTRELYRRQSDLTLPELRARLGEAVSVQTLSRAVRALGLSLNKRSGRRPSRTARTSP